MPQDSLSARLGGVRSEVVMTNGVVGGGDVHDAVDRLAREHGQSLLNFAYLTARDPDLAQDAVQATFAALLALDHVPEHPLAYARRSIHNYLVSRARRRLLLKSLLPSLLESRGSGDGTFEGIVADGSFISQQLSLLGPRARTAIVLRYYADVSDAGIADVLNCSQATARSIISRALRKIRKSIES